MSQDFDHQVRIDQIRDGDRIDLSATESEREAIAQRLGLPSIDRLDAHAILARDGEAIRAQGRITASLQQRCVVTGDPIAASVDEPFGLKFMPDPGSAPDEEVELGEDDCDVIFHDGATIDLGSAIADTLALSLDPYPRSAGAEAALKEAGVLSEDEAGPFAGLAALRDKLGGNDA